MNPSSFLPDPAVGAETGGQNAGPTCPFAALAMAMDAKRREELDAVGANAPGNHGSDVDDKNGFHRNSSFHNSKASSLNSFGDNLRRTGSDESRSASFDGRDTSPTGFRSSSAAASLDDSMGRRSFKVACPMTGGLGNATDEPYEADSSYRSAAEVKKPAGRSAASRWAKVRAVAAMATLGKGKGLPGQIKRTGSNVMPAATFSMFLTPARYTMPAIQRQLSGKSVVSAQKVPSSFMRTSSAEKSVRGGGSTRGGGSVSGRDRRNSLLRFDDDARSVAASAISGSRNSRADVPQKNMIVRAGGGGVVVGEIMSRLDKRAGQRTKCPPFKEEDAKNYGEIIEKTWSILLEKVGYFELGLMYYDTIFQLVPEIAQVFTKQREEMGIKFVDMLAMTVSICKTPPKLHEKLASLSAMHISRGVEASMMAPMGRVLFKVLETGIGSELFSTKTRNAWKWLWEWLTTSMQLTLSAAEEPSSLIQTSWDIVMENFSEEDLGSMFYDTLFGLAPNLKSLFHKPKQVMATKFVEMICTLVSFGDDDQHMTEQLTWMGARHVKYGARPHHIPIMSEVLLTVLEQAVGDDWRDETREAWQELWDKACGIMMDSVKLGETHGHHVEELWDKVNNGKDIEHEVGMGVVKYLKKLHPLLVQSWTEEYDIYSKSGDMEKIEQKAQGDGDNIFAPVIMRKDEKSAGNAAAKGSFSQAATTISGVHFSLRNKKSAMSKNMTQSSKDLTTLVGTKLDPADAFGHEIWSMLKIVIKNMWQPEVMNECLIVVATRWSHFGLLTSHVADLGVAIQFALQNYMERPCSACKMFDWTPEFEGAWKWLWLTASMSLTNTLSSLEKEDSIIVRANWEDIKQMRTREEVGEKMFGELGREAPQVLHLFQRPKKLQAYMWMQAIELLVIFTEKPQDFFDALKSLTIRHVKYGVKGENVKPFGKAILAGVEDLSGETFTPKIGKAWGNLWRRISTCVGRSLNVGVNLITVAIVNGDVEKFKYAICCAPRKDRMSWVTRIEVYGSIMSPLYWAIRDGKFSIAQYMIQDLLSIRADRDMYYYGRQHLFETHPDIIMTLCKDCPMLIDDLMDGLLWYSQHVHDGKVRANYYIRELYGSPEDTIDAWKSPLAVLCLHGQPEMFLHPVVSKLLELKWDAYGKKIFIAVQLFFAAIMITYTDGHLVHGVECTDRAFSVRCACGILSAIAFLSMSYLIFKQFSQGQTTQVNIFKGLKCTVPRLICNPWNAARYVSMVFLMIASVADATCNSFVPSDPSEPARSPYRDPEDTPTAMMFITAAAGLLMWAQLIQALVMSTRLAALTYVIGQLFGDVGRFIVLIGIVLFSFAAAMTALQEPGFEAFEVSAKTLLRVFLNLEPPAEYPGVDSAGTILLILYAVITNVGLLSILIAQLALAYEHLSEDKAGYAKMNRAFVCVEVDSYIPMSYRLKIWNAFDFFKPIEFDHGDEGPEGGVQVMEAASVRASPKYKPDRIIRCTGTASPHDPWPLIATEVIDSAQVVMQGPSQ